jgi:heme A synthase
VTLHKVRPGDVLAGLGGVALLVVMFVPWYGFLEGAYTGTRDIAANNTDQSAWQALHVTLVPLVLLALLGIALLVTTAFERTSAYPVAAQVLTALVGTIASVWILIRLLNPPGPNFAADRLWGAWAGTALVLAITAGAWWSMRDADRPDRP